MAARPYVLIGNWKMHKTVDEARRFVQELLTSFQEKENMQVGLAVPYTTLYPLSQELKGSPLLLGAQNMNDASEGAFTGEIAGSMLLEAGAQFVILGHSERRHLYKESNSFIHRKLVRAVEVGLKPILCIGETREQHEQELAYAVIEEQLKEGIKDLTAQQLQQLVIAYEPVWAVGTGQSADPSLVQSIHSFCRQILSTILDEEFAQTVVIQYGGSVTPANAEQLLEKPDIDGLLIGGASLSLESFLQIINHKYSKNQSEG